MDLSEKKRIENVVMDIMINDGTEMHTEGADVIADFIEAILDGNEDEWQKKYFSQRERYLTGECQKKPPIKEA